MLSRIGSTLGKPLFSYSRTFENLKLGYARVLIEKEINGGFPNEIFLENEYSVQLYQKVVYEWKPIRCINGMGFGHEASYCKSWAKQGGQGKCENGVGKVEGNSKGKQMISNGSARMKGLGKTLVR